MIAIIMTLSFFMFKAADYFINKFVCIKIGKDILKMEKEKTMNIRNLNCKKLISKNKVKRKAVELKRIGYAFN